MKKSKLLIIGSIPHQGIINTYGGTTISMKSFIDFCKMNNIKHDFIQANKYLKPIAPLLNFIYVITSLLKKINSSSVVMLNVASNGAFYLSPFVFIIARAFKKKIVFRKFGGNFHHLIKECSKWQLFILEKTILKSDVLLFQTKEMVKFFNKYENYKTKVFWLKTTRKKPRSIQKLKGFQFKYVFISQIKKTKGIFEIIDAAKNLSTKYTIDIYGPFLDENISENVFNNSRVNYKGILKPEEVIPTLAKYNVLLLPTYHSGEGYPGIIIEALSLGIPVITTYWNAIPEMITNKNEGILIKPQSKLELFNAITSINKENYIKYSSNAYNRFSDFDEDLVYKDLIKIILE